MTFPLPAPKIGGGGVAAQPVSRASGDWFYPLCQASTANLATLANGAMRVSPWLADSNFILTAIEVDVTAAGDSGCKFRPVIYSDAGGAPNTLLVDGGQLPADAVGIPVASSWGTLQIVAGTVYWIGGIVQLVTTTQPTIRCLTNTAQFAYAMRYTNGAPPATGGILFGLYPLAGIPGTPPTQWPTGFTQSAQSPRLAFQVA